MALSIDIVDSPEGLASWPDADLEWLGFCPCCSSPIRTMKFDELTDLSFGCAGGRWKLWECGVCAVQYLDPRPNSESIGRAYSAYYTHEGADRSSWLRRIGGLARSALGSRIRDGSVAYRLGHKGIGSPVIGRLTARLSPRTSISHQLAARHLPPALHSGSQLLDVGAGSGEFLQFAARMGYRVTGVDPDPKAVSNATKRGLSIVQGGFPAIPLESDRFEHVTLNHVLEHVHQPFEALLEVRRLLADGGRIWIATPNTGSLVYRRFGEFWRGLEAPRHLCLFNIQSLTGLLERAGYRGIRFHPNRRDAEFFVRTSLMQQSGVLPHSPEWKAVPPDWSTFVHDCDEAAQSDAALAEVVIASAYK